MNKPAARHILTINGGSSSIKFSLFEADETLHRIADGAIEHIGQADAALRVECANPADSLARGVAAANYTAAAEILLGWITEHSERFPIAAVGHRIVHGGPNYSAPQRISAEMTATLHELSPFDPTHLPQEIMLTEMIARRFPGLPQIACFDTAFHHDLPRKARILPIPRRYEAQGIRRYGFHGLSYEFMMEELARLGDPAATKGRVILAHLGNGASLAAVHDGKSVDTSMGFTPAAGVPMSTRSGDLDPGLFWYLARTENMGAQQFNDMVNFQSGLLGISETSSDMRDLLACEAGDVRAADAVEYFCYQIRKQIGAYAAALGGVDTLVFSGGIGAHSPLIRERICTNLNFLGIELNPEFNAKNAPLISTATAPVRVRAMATNEEKIIARSVFRVLNPG